MLSFSEWLEVHALASKKKGRSIDMLLQSLKVKFHWVLNQAKKVGLPPLQELATFGKTAEDKKRKRSKMIKHMFVKEDVEVDGTQRNVAPPAGVIGKIKHVIREPEAGFFYLNGNLVTVICSRLRGDEVHLSAKRQLAVKGLSECKASKSNDRRIQVKDTVKEVEDYLKA
ncbi:hypothetical protein Tco_0830933 [Tanacetum coccineum]